MRFNRLSARKLYCRNTIFRLCLRIVSAFRNLVRFYVESYIRPLRKNENNECDRFSPCLTPIVHEK
jgi:hypothetical protein